MKALFHIDESIRWGMTLKNAANMLQYGEASSLSFEIEIVANGSAVAELKPDNAQKAGLFNQLEELAQAVRICACNNALLANGIAPHELFQFVRIVPAGVVEIAIRQADGYAYIKP